MEIQKISSVPIAKITMVVDEIRHEGQSIMLVERSSAQGTQYFALYVPKRLEAKIKVGDSVTVLCVPDTTFTLARVSLIVSYTPKPGTGRHSYAEVIWSADNVWDELFGKLI
jgi:hypothetical protein